MFHLVLRLQTLTKPKQRLVTLSLTAMLTALYILLDRVLTLYPLPSVKIGFAFLPVAVAALLLGPVPAALTAGLGDLLGSLLMPVGTPMPLLTVSAALEGLVLGLLVFEKPGTARRWRSRWVRVGLGLVGVSVVLHLLFNSFALALLFSPDAIVPYMLMSLPMRAAKDAVMLVVQFAVYGVLMKLLLAPPKQNG